MMILITGGSASGKSALAEKAAATLATGPAAYIATMQVLDDESRQRVKRHRAMRSGRGFETLESPLALPGGTAITRYNTALLECVSNLLANRIYSGGQTPQTAALSITREVGKLAGRLPNIVIVTNDIFSDGGGYSPETSAYLAALGQINRSLARRADLVVEVVRGIPVYLKGEGGLPL